jgi:hypothetical protein
LNFVQLYIETSVEIIWAILIVIWVAAAFTSKKSIRRQSMGSRLTMILVAFICGFGLSQAAIYGHFLLARWTMGSGITSVIGLVRGAGIVGKIPAGPKLERDRHD